MYLKRFYFSSFSPRADTSYSKLLYFANRKYAAVADEGANLTTSKIKKLLENSSPLKEDLFKDNEFATTPYPEGTHFTKDRQTRLSFRPRCDPKLTSIIFFPGQGTQFLGMGKELLRYPLVKDMYASASEVLGYDLLKLCLQGPAELLNRTEYCQPAVLVTSLAALEKLKEENPEAINGCVTTAGFSLGEIAALVFAGSLTFEQGVRLVKVRAEAMQLCCEVTPSGMMTVMYGADSPLKQACADARQHCVSIGIDNPICLTTNYLCPGLKIIGGHSQALNFIAENAAKYKLRKISRLPVSGAFHSELMRPAAEVVKQIIRKMPIKDPIIPVHSNIDGKRYINANHVVDRVPRQIYLPVRWEQILHILYSRTAGEDFPYTFECGPGNSLTTILKKVNAKAHTSCSTVNV